MTDSRPHPVTLLLGELIQEKFPAIQESLNGEVTLDAFLVNAPALELLRELRPDEGIGEAVDDFVAFVHAVYLHWVAGSRTLTVDPSGTHALCHKARRDGPPARASAPSGTMYIQIAPRIVWGQLGGDGAFEPLDGWFVRSTGVGLNVVACFGVHSERPGLSVAVVEGPRPSLMRRDDGTVLFDPLMPGGNAAGLHAVGSADELLLLAWRALDAEGT